jgi:hypothetical protein
MQVKWGAVHVPQLQSGEGSYSGSHCEQPSPSQRSQVSYSGGVASFQSS